MKIALVTAFPPSRGALNEYGFHIAAQLQAMPGIELTILGDDVPQTAPELDGFRVIRCWGFDRSRNILSLLGWIRRLQPDVVWLNLGFASMAARPLPAILALTTPAITRLAGTYTHVTLHQLFETVDLADAGVKAPGLYRAGGWLATHLLLSANSLTVLLPGYRTMLREKYKRGKVHARPHGIFTGRPSPPDFNKRGNPMHRILAFGKWGTYKRLELLISAFERLLSNRSNVELVIAGGDHPKTPGYIAATAARHANPNIRFLGYVREEEIGELFQSASIAVMPYTSSAGSSGVAHLAAQHGVPILASDIQDFRQLVEQEGLAIHFFVPGDVSSLETGLRSLLDSPEQLMARSQQNFAAALRMTMPEVVRQYVRSFDRSLRLRLLEGLARVRESTTRFAGSKAAARLGMDLQAWENDLTPQK